jgi:hypothetical protein
MCWVKDTCKGEKTNTYDFCILFKNDLPVEDDPLRDFKGMGDYFFADLA